MERVEAFNQRQRRNERWKAPCFQNGIGCGSVTCIDRPATISCISHRCKDADAWSSAYGKIVLLLLLYYPQSETITEGCILTVLDTRWSKKRHIITPVCCREVLLLPGLATCVPTHSYTTPSCPLPAYPLPM